VSSEELGVLEENGVRRNEPEEGVERLVALGRALSDPIRVRMLGMMADGRGCCDFSGSRRPGGRGGGGHLRLRVRGPLRMGQSKVSYHVRKLKEAGLVREERRGKWSFYSLDRETAGDLLGVAADRLLSAPEKRSVGGSGCC
jgi:ArsR family transcriptional regulator